jgi:hypothetical protein
MADDDRLLRLAHEQASGRVWAGFVDMKEVAGFGDFLEKWPMYWMPRKEEVARILSVAKQMHAACGAASSEPLRILEIGSANAFLADLVVDLAEENGFDVAYTIVDPESETVKEAAMAHVGDARFSFHTETVERFVAKMGKGIGYDLVINAWMPPDMDFTEAIRAAHGAAIIYVIETWGGTGMQGSYDVGKTYKMESGWVGHSLPELQHQEKESVKEFCNAFLVQRRLDLTGDDRLLPDPVRAGIKIGEPYPWEAELTKQQGEIAPVIPVGDQTYHDNLAALAVKMLKKRKGDL